MIRSAIVPVAGHGTRLLPATKSQPKEMLPVARKPIVQYVAEELAANGINQLLFVTGRNKTSIENHFDLDPELQRVLANRKDLLEELDFQDWDIHYFYTRQRMQKGLGDAILCGENFAGEQPFVVALGDSIVGLNAKSRALSRMVELFESRSASCVIAVEEVPNSETSHYGIIEPAEINGDSLRVVNLIEKPKPVGCAEQSRHRRPLRVFAPDLRHDPRRQARCSRRGATHRRHPAPLRRGPPCPCREASEKRETLRHRQLPELFRDVRRIRPRRPDLRR